ncbi:uncharacterized protein LOC112128107 [Cimex lectularius]|uniref:CCHC-type domain-containing protein n=1 Tax=Cimex lectularius TaxID=79782 RepID=A0A8I6SNV2_CIMLE|nr:uncharacterized protein LOC112128107 [Cimex lectularius]
MVLRVPKEDKPEEIATQLVENNRDEGVWTKENVRPLFTVRYGGASRKDAQFVSWVVEVDPQTLKSAIGRGRVNLDYQTCAVREYLGVTRCYNCQAYGHVASACSKKGPTCGVCADSHDTRKCSSKNLKCANCLRIGKAHNHRAGSQYCEAQIRAVAGVMCATDYESSPQTLVQMEV